MAHRIAPSDGRHPQFRRQQLRQTHLFALREAAVQEAAEHSDAGIRRHGCERQGHGGCHDGEHPP